MYTINIGLDNPVTGKQNTIDQTLAVALRYISGVADLTVSRDRGETTLVINYLEPVGSFVVLCAELDQDCVAVYDITTERGELIGPKAEAWGGFDHGKFQFI